MSLWTRMFGTEGDRLIARFSHLPSNVNAREAELQGLSLESLSARGELLKQRARSGETTESLLPEAFALVREMSRRTLGQRHYDVQILGGAIIDHGAIAEMKTGEGKTLVATLPAYLNALSGKGVHVVTVNDYLARRDAVWMGQIYHALGLSVSVLNHDVAYVYDPSHVTKEDDHIRDEVGSFKIEHEFLRKVSRRDAYQADITYGTNHEFGFDYLRDNLAHGESGLVQRADTPHHFAIVDEIDSILIDEARTPLIISAPSGDSSDLYVRFADIAKKLTRETDYSVDEKHRQIQLTQVGIDRAEKMLGMENIYSDGGIKYVHHLETAVRAEALFRRDTDYVVKDDEVIIVDQSTGRLQPGRRWSEGLHQAIEAKEGVKIQEESRTFASISFQNYFRLYGRIAGMTGTAATSAEEFRRVYGLVTCSIPSHRPSRRVDHDDLIFQNEKGKFQVIAKKVAELHAKGQPVLVGTASIEKNEVLSEYLKREGIPHEVLNAKNHEREGEIIAQAGKKGSVVIATNMAGRGVDIRLGGMPVSTDGEEEIRALGGLYVLGTERHDARRIDNQLRGRAGRQGDPGATQFYLSLEDSLMRVFASDLIKNMMGRFGIPDDEPIHNRLVSKSIETAQNRIEGLHFDSRKYVLEYDDVMNLQRTAIYRKRREMLLASPERLEEILQSIGVDVQSLRVRMGEQFVVTARQVALQVLDLHWVDHLETMEYLVSSVRLRAYGQRDPLVEYKKEAIRLFRGLEATINADIVHQLTLIGDAPVKGEEEKKLSEVHRQASLITGESKDEHARIVSSDTDPAHVGVGRNDPCPCGSGKKFKKCGDLNTEDHQRLMVGNK